MANLDLYYIKAGRQGFSTIKFGQCDTKVWITLNFMSFNKLNTIRLGRVDSR